MAKQVASWYVELKDTGTDMVVRYSINDTVETDLIKHGELTHTVVPTNTVTVERAAILAEIKVKEGIA